MNLAPSLLSLPFYLERGRMSSRPKGHQTTVMDKQRRKVKKKSKKLAPNQYQPTARLPTIRGKESPSVSAIPTTESSIICILFLSKTPIMWSANWERGNTGIAGTPERGIQPRFSLLHIQCSFPSTKSVCLQGFLCVFAFLELSAILTRPRTWVTGPFLDSHDLSQVTPSTLFVSPEPIV